MTTPPQPDRGNEPEENEGLEGRMSFFEHLAELRKRLIYALISIGVGAIAGLAISQRVLTWVSLPMTRALQQAHQTDKLIYTSPMGVLGLVIHLGFYLGFVIASPLVFYQVWLFVAPGLYRHERRAVTYFLVASVGLFLAGIAFAYFVLLPYVLRMLLSFQGPFMPLISINEYFDLSLMLMIGVGVVFELPVLILLLSLVGLVTPRFLWKNMRYAILIITVVAAVLAPTPGDVSMLIFMAIMFLLYVISIAVSYMVVRSKRRAAMAQAEGR